MIRLQKGHTKTDHETCETQFDFSESTLTFFIFRNSLWHEIDRRNLEDVYSYMLAIL